jgi:hypothetical protein
MKKSIIALIILVAVVFAFTACVNNKTLESKIVKEPVKQSKHLRPAKKPETYKYVYVVIREREPQQKELQQSETNHVFVPITPVIEEPTQYLTGDARFTKADPCDRCSGSWNPNDPRQPKPGQVSPRIY